MMFPSALCPHKYVDRTAYYYCANTYLLFPGREAIRQTTLRGRVGGLREWRGQHGSYPISTASDAYCYQYFASGAGTHRVSQRKTGGGN